MRSAIALALALALVACAAQAEELTVFAAASLREAFSEVARAFEARHPGVHVALQFAGSQELRVQIENGAPADVFASADDRQMALAREQALSPAVFARNLPVLIVPRDNPAGLRSFADLPKARRIVLAAREVPIGAYSARILSAAHLDVEARVVSRELNVRQVLAKVALGEADAGIVYRTDARGHPEVQQIEIPRELNVVAEYPIAALRRAPHPALAKDFVALVLSPAGREALARFGFMP